MAGSPSASSLSVIVPVRDAQDAARAWATLAPQTTPEWECLLCVPAQAADTIQEHLAVRDARLRVVASSSAGSQDLVHAGATEARHAWVSVLDPRDSLETWALEGLVHEAQQSGHAGACGRFRFRCALGEVDLQPAQRWELSTALGIDAWHQGKVAPLGAMVVRREAFAKVRVSAPLELGGDFELALALAHQGVRWACLDHSVATLEMDLPLAPGQIRQRLAAHANALAAWNTAHLDGYGLAIALLDQFEEQTRRVATDAAYAHTWAAKVAFGNLFGQWWQRCRFLGPPPWHALQAAGTLEQDGMDVEPGEIAQHLARLASGHRRVTIFGLGRNGREVARALARDNLSIHGRDDACRASPPWSGADDPQVAVLEPDAPFSEDEFVIVSPLVDDALVRRVPTGVASARWSAVAQELREQKLARRLAPWDSLFPRETVARIYARAVERPTPKQHATPPSDTPPLDIFLGSYNRPEKLAAMLDSVRATGYPARVLVAAGDLETVRVCESFPGLAHAVYNTEVNQRIGCTAPLNHVFRALVRHDALFCTDDCVFERDALHIAMQTLYATFPAADGVVGLAQENIWNGGYPLAFPLFGKRFLDRFRSLPECATEGIALGKPGDIFWPGYFHLFNDLEIGLTIQCLGCWVYEPRAKLRHYHPEFGGGTMDATHAHGLRRSHEDTSTLLHRRVQGLLWGLDLPAHA